MSESEMVSLQLPLVVALALGRSLRDAGLVPGVLGKGKGGDMKGGRGDAKGDA